MAPVPGAPSYQGPRAPRAASPEVEVLSEGFAVVDAPARLKLRLGDDVLAPGRAFARWRAFLALAPELTRYGLLPREVDLRFENRIVLKAPGTEGPRSET